MNTLSQRLVPLFVLAVSVLALATAFVAQYGFGLKPCELCLIQRVPFAVAGLLSLAALMPRFAGRICTALMVLAALAFLINSGIAVYHVGVEQHWWASRCAGNPAAALDLNDLASMMSKPVEARCDEPAWSWHGITMAAMNVPFSALLGLATLFLIRRAKVQA